jgi:hypothetical protein
MRNCLFLYRSQHCTIKIKRFISLNSSTGRRSTLWWHGRKRFQSSVNVSRLHWSPQVIYTKCTCKSTLHQMDDTILQYCMCYLFFFLGLIRRNFRCLISGINNISIYCHTYRFWLLLELIGARQTMHNLQKYWCWHIEISPFCSHRAINLFLPPFSDQWLAVEDTGQDMLVSDLCVC